MASERTVSQGTLYGYGKKYDVWVFANVPFIREDGELVNGGYAQINRAGMEGRPIAKLTGSLSGSDLIIAPGVLPVTENSIDRPGAELRAYLVDPGRQVAIEEFCVFGRGFRVPDGDDPITWAEIEANMVGTIPPNVAHDVFVGGNFHGAGNGLFDGNLDVDGIISGDGQGITNIQNSALPTVLAGKTLNNTQLTGSLTGLLSSMLPTVLQNKTLQNPTFSGTTSFSQNLNIAGTVTAAHLAGEGSAISGVIAAGVGNNSSTGAAFVNADTDNSGGADRRFDVIMGQGGFATTPFSIVENKFGFNTPVGDALMTTMWPYPDIRHNVPFRFRTNQSGLGRADFVIFHDVNDLVNDHNPNGGCQVFGLHYNPTHEVVDEVSASIRFEMFYQVDPDGQILDEIHLPEYFEVDGTGHRMNSYFFKRNNAGEFLGVDRVVQIDQDLWFDTVDQNKLLMNWSRLEGIAIQDVGWLIAKVPKGRFINQAGDHNLICLDTDDVIRIGSGDPVEIANQGGVTLKAQTTDPFGMTLNLAYGAFKSRIREGGAGLQILERGGFDIQFNRNGQGDVGDTLTGGLVYYGGHDDARWSVDTNGVMSLWDGATLTPVLIGAAGTGPGGSGRALYLA